MRLSRIVRGRFQAIVRSERVVIMIESSEDDILIGKLAEFLSEEQSDRVMIQTRPILQDLRACLREMNGKYDKINIKYEEITKKYEEINIKTRKSTLKTKKLIKSLMY